MAGFVLVEPCLDWTSVSCFDFVGSGFVWCVLYASEAVGGKRVEHALRTRRQDSCRASFFFPCWFFWLVGWLVGGCVFLRGTCWCDLGRLAFITVAAAAADAFGLQLLLPLICSASVAVASMAEGSVSIIIGVVVSRWL